MIESPDSFDGEQSDSRYEENSDFTEYLDEEGEIEIAGITFHRSWVLYNMDPIAYDSALRDFRQRREEDFKEMVYNDFPTPIAYPFYRSERGFENNIQRLHFLRDTWESLIFVLYAIVVGESLFLEIPMNDAKIKKKEIFSDKLSTKLNIIKQLLNLEHVKNYELNSRNVITNEVIEKLIELNRTRNGFSHSPAISEAQATKIYSECYLDVFLVLHDLKNLKDIQLLRYIGQKENPHNLRCETFRGYSTTKTIKTITIDQDQLTNSAKYLDEKYILVMNNKHIYSISPFLHFKQDTSGHQTSICVCKKKSGEDPNQKLGFEILGRGGKFELKLDDFRTEITKLHSLLSLDEGGP